MKERPILFNGDMVRAILEGRKTQTRRVVKPQCSLSDKTGFNWKGWAHGLGFSYFETVRNFAAKNCPYGKVGDQLWVRETWRGWVCINPPSDSRKLGVARYIPAQVECKRLDYKATQYADNEPYRPSIHMPRWASRINLEITAVRVERLNDMSTADAIAEGAQRTADGGAWHVENEQHRSTDPRDTFASLWESINGAGSWEQNPWVWVIEFRKIQEAA